MIGRAIGHLRWRLDGARRARERLHRSAPDRVEIYGVRLQLGDWATDTLRSAIYDQWYEAREIEIVKATVQPDDRVVEIGCGVGVVSTVAGRIASSVDCYDANPEMVAVTRQTLERNGVRANVVNAVLQHAPKEDAIQFYMRPDFWSSSLQPGDGATAITVPVLDLNREIAKLRGSYFVVDIEGAETQLLQLPLPACVQKLCVECHPHEVAPHDTRVMLQALLAQGFFLDLEHSSPPVLYFTR
jgi:FkbM family methyltransferase